MTTNRLAGETSPYLLAHKDNPVHWQPWDQAALALAQDAKKPILLSIGYSACHWCHVMARESFEDPATAALMNDLFVNIKVDREQRPDLDQLYLAGLARLGMRTGWPLTAFLTPDGAPFAGGSYFPPEARYDLPAFRDLLTEMAGLHAQDPQEVLARGAGVIESLRAEAARSGDAGALGHDFLDHAASRLLAQVDPVYGGFGAPGAPKFPQPALHELLWRAYLRSGNTTYRDAVCHALAEMCQGGLYDHLGGGFHRYTVEDDWLVPHFEKMLYDNALLIDLMVAVWQGNGDDLLQNRIAETVDWALGEMRLEEGAFAASLSAESEPANGGPPEEGAYYLWREEEIDRLLGDDAATFMRVYGVTPAGHVNGASVLHRSSQDTPADPCREAKLETALAKLAEVRKKRPRPARDNKILADWNGLMIAALANAAMVFERQDWLEVASEAFASVRDRLDDGEGRLCHGWAGGRPARPAFLDDYAALARAALVLFQARGEQAYITAAESWVERLDLDYWDDVDGGYFHGPLAAGLIVRRKIIDETATPAGNGLMIGVLARLSALTGKDRYRVRAHAIMNAFAGRLERSTVTVASALNQSEALGGLVQLVLVGPDAAPDMTALRRAAHGVSLPDLLLIPVPDPSLLPAAHPAAGKQPLDGLPTAYPCVADRCLPPVTSSAALNDALGQLDARRSRPDRGE